MPLIIIHINCMMRRTFQVIGIEVCFRVKVIVKDISHQWSIFAGFFIHNLLDLLLTILADTIFLFVAVNLKIDFLS